MYKWSLYVFDVMTPWMYIWLYLWSLQQMSVVSSNPKEEKEDAETLLLPSLTLSARKNVLFIGSDDMRPNLNLYSDVTEGVFASPTMHTPNLDKVAKSQNNMNMN